jgi:serine/threonine-protein kinase
MTPERWRRVEELCHAALERDVTLRAAYLHEACVGDDSLRREVESLLAQEEQAGSFLEASPLQDIAAQAARDAMSFGGEPSESQNAAQETSLVGRQLGSYLVRAKIGEGGMGEVYRAFDTKLRRDVALKVLPKPFARDPERLARFRREAQLLASLNHKNIAAIYGFEELPEANFLVLELVEGETFAERIQRQEKLPIPQVIKDALTLAGQVAEGLEAAHRKGITHRDIKPANIKVTPEGEVKVLDFGLAKAFAGDRANADLSELPTLEPGPTRDGQILGTPAYMSPEQVRGQEVDKRTDIWAFGCVLYEMLTGQRPFQSPDRKGGGTLADIIAAVLNKEPEWAALPADTPPTIRTLLRRCLQKDPNRRLHDIADARIEIEEALSASATTVPAAARAVPAHKNWRAALLPVLASVAMAAVIAGVAVWNLRQPTPRPIERVVVPLAAEERLLDLTYPVVALSPDGAQLAYKTNRGIYVRAMDSFEARLLPGTEAANDLFFSPDGQWLGFFASGMKKVSVSGGAVLSLTNTSGNPRGASWGPNDMIVFPPTSAGGLSQVPAAGGEPQALTKLKEGEIGHRWPQFLPDGKSVLFAVQIGGNSDDWHIAAQRLDATEHQILIRGGTYARYVPTGHLVYYRAGTIMAVPFDPVRLEVMGTPAPVIEGVTAATGASGAAQFSFSSLGSLAYVPGGSAGQTEMTLVWVDRKGAEQPLPAPPRAYDDPRLSPDGQQVALIEGSTNDVWVYDIPRATLARLTFEGTSDFPLWTPDGKRIVFVSTKAGVAGLYWKPADGSGPEERLTTSEVLPQPSSVSPDGKTLAFNEVRPNTGHDIWVLSLEGTPSRAAESEGDPRQAGAEGRKPKLFLQAPFGQFAPMFSPDGRWLAYHSMESGRGEIYVQPFPGPGGKWLISSEGGDAPVWARNGRELFYRNGEKMMVVDITTQPGFRAGTPRMLFERSGYRNDMVRADFDVSPDGQRFLVLKAKEQPQAAAATQIHVVLNWFEELKRRVPSGQ